MAFLFLYVYTEFTTTLYLLAKNVFLDRNLFSLSLFYLKNYCYSQKCLTTIATILTLKLTREYSMFTFSFGLERVGTVYLIFLNYYSIINYLIIILNLIYLLPVIYDFNYHEV